MKGRSLSFEQLRIVNQHPSFVGVAAELVQYNNKYENVVSNLLGTVIVAKDLRGANELAKQLQYRYRIVTIEGDVVNRRFYDRWRSKTGEIFFIRTST